MNKCKNCGEETNKKNIYCSYKCRNIYVNKNLRDYSKNSNSLKKKELEKEKKYYNEPKRCKECDKIISYNKKRNSFCCGSCSTSYTNKNRKKVTHILSDEGYNNIKKSNRLVIKEKYKKEKKEYYSNKKRCPNCNKIIAFNKRVNNFCDRTCKKEYYRKNRTDVENYKIGCQFKFSLKNYKNEFDFKLVEKHGWYKAKNRGDNLDGVSRDHMYSVMEGFRNNIDTKIISHPANCKLMIHNKNVSKRDKCTISLEKLKEKIIKWELKYK